MGRGQAIKSPAGSLLGKDHKYEIPKHMGGDRSGEKNDKSIDHSLSKESRDRTERY
mgnify:CR=1 FL=1